MAVTKYLNKTGLIHFWSEIKAWCKATFALISHTHDVATTSANGFLSSTDKTKLDNLRVYPKITGIYTAYMADNGSSYIVDSSFSTLLSTEDKTRLEFYMHKGLNGKVEEGSNSLYAYKKVHFVLDGNKLAGDGLIGSAGTLSVPEYEGATASANATSGLVPPALISERDYVLKGNGTWYNINSKANDDNVVHKTGNESIAGVKTFTDNLVMSNSKSIIFDLSASTPTVSTVRDFPIVFKSQSTAGNYTFTKCPFFEIPTTASNNYGLGVGFGASALTIIGAGESPRDIVAAEELTGTMEKLVLTSDTGIDFFVNCNTIANRIPLSITSAGTTFLYSICSTYTDRTRGDTVTSWTHKTLYFGDKYARDNKEFSDAHTYGLVRSSVDASSSNLSFIAFRNTIANSSWGITITAPTDTSLPCYARLTSSPDISDDSTKIATTAFVKAQGYLTGVVAVANGGTGHGERLTETTAADFNDYTNTGEYHVRFSVDTLNRPYAYTDYRDCILTVSNITPSSNVSSYYRTLQTAIVLNPTVDKHPTMFIRKKYNNSNNEWSNWYQVSYINDSPEKFSNLAINLDTISTTPSTDIYSTIYQCHANDNKTVADMYIGRSTSSSGYTSTVLRTRCSDGVSTNHAYFHLWCNADGTSKYSTTSAIFDSTDNSDKIPTTAWIRTATGNTLLNAATASKLGTSTIGDSSQPIYLNNGSPVECDMGAYPYKGVETSNTVLPVRWPWTDIRTDSTEGFDKFTTIGRYHVNASADTFNNPTNTTMDGVLIVDATTSASSVSSYYRIKQTYLTLGSAGTYAHVYIRGAYYNSSETKWVFGAWKELSFTDHTHDTDYVKLTGDQTIAGNKTFSSRITLHGPMSGRGIEFVANTLVKGTAPSSNQAMYFYFIDKNGYSSSQNNVFGAVGISQYTNGTVAARLVGYSNDASSSTYGAVVAGVDSDGVAFAMATSTSNTRTEGTDIVTRNWIPKDTRIVHTTSNETIDGIKTFSSSPIAPTPTTSDNSTKVATTAFVKAQNYITSSSNITGTATNVTGTVAIANGGTGATTRLNAIKALVNESVSTNATHFLGMKSDWSKVGYVSVADAKTVLGLGTAAYSDAGTFATFAHTHDYLPLTGGSLTGSIKLNATSTIGIYKGNATSLTEFSGGSALNKGARIAFYGESHSSNAGRFDLIAGSTSASKSLIGKPDGTLTWGGQSVSTSSDERIKTKLQNVPESILNAWENVEWGEFKFLEAVADKGESARLHTGLIAQAVDRAFKAKDLDACKYGILCHEEREATEDEPAVDLWTVRYTEALAMEAAYQRRKNKILENRISELEKRLAKLEGIM